MHEAPCINNLALAGQIKFVAKEKWCLFKYGSMGLIIVHGNEGLKLSWPAVLQM